MTVPKEYVNALRLTRDEIERILQDMQKDAASYSGEERRMEPRYAYLGHHVVLVEIRYPNKYVGTFRAVTQNISTSGLCFLHGAFVHTGSTCRAILRDTKGGLAIVRGTVVRCHLIEGRVHEVGMQFDEAIDLTDLMPAEELAKGPLGTGEVSRTPSGEFSEIMSAIEPDADAVPESEAA